MNLERLLKLLQTKVASLGYNKKELRGIAEAISNNSELGEDATDEQMSVEIDAVLPYLRVGQQQANRIASANANANDQSGNEGNNPKPPVTPTNPNTQPNQGDDTPQWAKRILEQTEELSNRLSAMEGERTTNSRLERLKTAVDGCGAMGEATLRGFGRMHFANDSEFEEYLSEVEQSVEEYKKTLGDEALGSMTGKPSTENRAIDYLGYPETTNEHWGVWSREVMVDEDNEIVEWVEY